jgi:pimeloyl-ACP methyl ester carboxylesterase
MDLCGYIFQLRRLILGGTERTPGMTKVLFCHGLESGPHGSKYRALVAAGYDVIAPDCRGMMDLAQRVAIVAPILVAEKPLVVGSSFGGIVAILAALETRVKLPGMVLCAPALERANVPLETLVVPNPVTIIHGRNDTVIPIELVEVEDDHFLANCDEEILEALRTL